MAIENDDELRDAVSEAGRLLQEIQNYCGTDYSPQTRVRFPRGFLRTTNEHRRRLSFLSDETLKSNLAYTLILSDAIFWLFNRTDITATAKDMLIKLYVFLAGAMIEGITKEYLQGQIRRRSNYKERTEHMMDNGIISPELRTELDWIWDTRNRMHLFSLKEREYDNNYTIDCQIRSALAFQGLIESISMYEN